MAVRLLVGLGNPGLRYENTRHNAGFWILDTLAQKEGVSLRREGRFSGEVGKTQEGCLFFKPTTFINRSGQALVALAGFYKILPTEILVFHDDLDLPPGTARLKQGGGHGGHNGLRDLIACFGPDFFRMRIGIGHPGQAREVVDYVLDRPNREDEEAIFAAIQKGLEVLPWVLAGELQKAMNFLHAHPPKEGKT